MENFKNNFGGYLKATNIIHLGLVIGLVLFLAITIFLVTSGNLTGSFAINREILLLIAILIGLSALVSGKMIFNQRMNQIEKIRKLSLKLADYRSALIVKYALIDGATLFCIVLFLLTGDYLLLIIIGILIATLIFNKPSGEDIISHLQLNDAEIEFINDPDREME